MDTLQIALLLETDPCTRSVFRGVVPKDGLPTTIDGVLLARWTHHPQAHDLWCDGTHPPVDSSSPSSLWRSGDTPKLATSGVMVNIRKSPHRHHHHSCSRSDITRYPCCIIMLLVLFNKIRVHSYDTVFCSFLVSSLGPLIPIKDPVHDHC